MTNLCFGRREHDPGRVKAAPTHKFGFAPPPPALNRTLVDFTPNLYNNDIYPDCTFVSMTNLIRGQAFLNGFKLAVDDGAPAAGYAACEGLANTAEAIRASDGAAMMDVVDWQSRNGYSIGPQTLVSHVGTVGMAITTMAQAIARVGGVWVGVRLYERDMDDADSATPWDIQEGRDDGALAGRHAINGWTYVGLTEGDRVWIGTWGVWKSCSWAWLLNRSDEAYGMVCPPVARTDGTFLDMTLAGAIGTITLAGSA